MDENEKRIRDAIEKMKAKGVRLVTGLWNVQYSNATGWKLANKNNQCACALGCLLLVEQPESNGLDHETVAAQVLGQPSRWADGFIQGFDGVSRSCDGSREGYELGKKLRAEYIDGEEG